MTFLKLIRSIPKDGEIPPELEHKLKSAANMLLAGREDGNTDLVDGTPELVVEYEDRGGLEEAGEPDMIESESNSHSEFTLDRDFDEPRCVLLADDDHSREIVIATGPRREIEGLKASLCMIRLKRGGRAYMKQVKKLRKKYLGELYGKGDN